MHGDPTNWHDAGLVGFVVGPRREVLLRLRVGDRGAAVRFGAVTNHEAVASFLNGLMRPPMPDAFLDTVGSLERIARGWLLTLDHGGAVRIETDRSPTVVGDQVV